MSQNIKKFQITYSSIELRFTPVGHNCFDQKTRYKFGNREDIVFRFFGIRIFYVTCNKQKIFKFLMWISQKYKTFTGDKTFPLFNDKGKGFCILL